MSPKSDSQEDPKPKRRGAEFALQPVDRNASSRYSPGVIRVVLFDIDGTLVRTGGAGVRAWDKAFAIEFGVPKALHGLSVAGRTDSSLVRECFVRHNIEPSARNFGRFYDT